MKFYRSMPAIILGLALIFFLGLVGSGQAAPKKDLPPESILEDEVIIQTFDGVNAYVEKLPRLVTEETEILAPGGEKLTPATLRVPCRARVKFFIDNQGEDKQTVIMLEIRVLEYLDQQTQ